MPAVSRKQQRFFGMVRATQKGEMENPSPEVAKAAASASMSSVKKFAKTKHKGLPEKKMKKEDYKYPLYASYKKVDEFHANKRPLDEEGYDHWRDKQLERGTWRSAGSNKPRSGGTQPKPMPKKKDGPSALDYVKKSIEAKYGKGAIMDTSKKKTQKEETLLEKGMSEKDMDSALKGHKYSKKQLMDMSKKSTKEGRHGEAQSMYKAARAMKEDTINERGDFWHPDPEKDRKLGGPGANQRAREDRAAASKPAAKKEDPKKLKKGESYMDYSKRQKASKKPRYSPELQKRIDAAKAKKKEGLGGKIMRKLGLKREEVEVLSFSAYLSEGNRTGRMMQKSKTQVTGHISADRGSDEKKNREGRKSLEKDLKKHGIGHKKGVGEYKYDSGETGREVSYQTSKPDKMSKRRFGKVMRRMGRKHGQESVITKDKDKPAKLHYTEKGSKAKSDSIGKTKAGKHPEGYGETSGTKVRGGKLPKKTNKSSYHYG